MSDDKKEKQDPKINRVYLKNIKSFVEAKLNLSDGVTVISGENGSGKSTIFEALGYCLFGVNAREFIGNVDNFIREGESSGMVEVEYTGSDQSDYIVKRGSSGGQQIYKVSEDGGKFPLEVADPGNFIRNTLGLRETIALDKQFTNIIGPFQEKFSAPFLETPAKRKEYFDDILGIKQWKDLYTKTRYWKRTIESNIDKLKTKIESMEFHVKDLPDLEENLKKNIDKTEQLKEKASEIESQVKSAEEKVKTLEGYETRHHQLESEIGTDSARKEQVSGYLTEREEELEKASQSLKIVEQNKESYEAYKKANEEKRDLEEKAKQRDRLIKLENELKLEIERKKTEIESSQKNYNDKKDKLNQKIKKTKTALEQKSEDLKSFENKVDEASRVLEEAEKSKETFEKVDVDIIKRRRQDIEEYLKEINEQNSELKDIQVQIARKDELEKKSANIEKIEQELNEKRNEISSLQQQKKDKKKGWKLLKEGSCPFFGEECLNLKDKQKNPDDYFAPAIEEIDRQIESKKVEVSHLQTQIKEARQAKDELVRIEEFQKQAESIEKKIKSFRNRILEEFPKREIVDLSFQLKSSIEGLKNDEIEYLLKELESTIDKFSYPGEITKYPEALKKAAEQFDRVKDEISKIAASVVKELTGKHRDKYSAHKSLEKEIERLTRELKDDSKELEKVEEDLKNLEEEKKVLQEKEQELEGVLEKLENYSGVQERMEELATILSTNEESFNLYIQHLQTSKEVGKIKEEIRKTRQDLENLVIGIAEKKEKIEELSKVYDPEKLKAARENFQQLAVKLNSAQKDLDALKKEFKELKKEIDEKKKVKSDIEKLEKETAEWEETKQFAAFLRDNIINRVADRVSEILRAQISEIASRIYRDISGLNEELNWGDSYSIQLVSFSGDKRKIRSDRQLSGGQLMSAVIAFRLAMLQAINSPFAFFDEPTSNLDEDRRQRLAEAFRVLNASENRWYRQMFLVSHDESFLDISGNVIELELDSDNQTRVLPGPCIDRQFSFVRVNL